MREGREYRGWGMASAIMSTFRSPARARITLRRDGTILLEAGTQEIGTGVPTILPQIAADVLGCPIDRVRLAIGDTTLPETGGTFGSRTTMTVGSAIADAATKLKARLAGLAGSDSMTIDDYAELLRQRDQQQVSENGSWSPGPKAGRLGEVPEWSMYAWGAVFVEVAVDEDIPIPRVRRCLGVYSAGRIINPKTARSQMTGGMIWGIGQALLEDSRMDASLGRYLSKNLAGHLVPINADVPDLDVHFVEEFDPHASTIGARGIGELAAVGVGPAILNAIWHATGVRVREVPVRPEMLLT
jgi:xanthine dehydrogenase YagR molybdenum-binding subunit